MASLTSAQSTLVLQPGSVTGMNSEISNYPSNLNNNYGNYGVISSYIWATSADTFSERALLQFDLLSIPSVAAITSAYLDLWASPPGNTFGTVLPSMQGSDNASYVSRITQPWNQNTVTWNNQPSEINSNQVILPTSTSGSENYLHIDVTQMVKDMVTYGNNGFMIEPVSTEPDNSMLFNSCNFSDTTMSPRLTITYKSRITPILNLGADTDLCIGQVLMLNATYPNSTYIWQDNSTGTTYRVSVGGSYSVTVTDSSGCSVSDTIKVSYASNPPAVDLGGSRQVCGDSLVLNPYISNAHFHWSDNSTDSTLTAFSSGAYSVTVTNGCGSGNAQVNLDFLVNQCALLVPTAFSPNGDGKNDIFRSISYCSIRNFSINVYNRWGELVYQSDDITVGWDGTFKERPQPVGVYTYNIEYFNHCKGTMDKKSGNITLIR